MVDPPRSHGEIFFSSGLYRVAEHAAVSAALSASTLGGGTVPSDRDPDLWQPLMGGATRPETLFLSGWFRPHLSSTVELWARSHDAEVQTSGGRQYLHLGAWTDGTDDSALELGGAQEALDEAFSWIAYRAPSSEQEKDPAAQPQVHETPVITPSVRYDHLVPASSAAAPAEVLAREATDWPPPCDRCFDQRWFLRAGSRLSQQAPGPEAPTNYRFDPAEPVFTIGGSSWDVASLLDAELLPQYPITPLEHGPLDQRRIPQRDDYLRFRSAVLDEPLHVRGNPRLELWVSTDAPDTSFVVKLVDMHPDGYQALLREVALSTRRRERAQGEPSPMTYAVAQRLDVDLGPLSVTFGAGHRVALHVTSSSWPAYEIHPNTHWDDSGATLRPAFQSLYHDREHLSVLVLPGVEEP
jgi:putative CocE/NonD family hydrolase